VKKARLPRISTFLPGFHPFTAYNRYSAFSGDRQYDSPSAALARLPGFGRPTALDDLRTPRTITALPESAMRSDLIHNALAKGMNRFEVCQLVSKGVRATHKTGSRFEDSINDVLQYMGTHETNKAGLHPAALARAA
jgi:hypothetical protein